MAQVLKVGEPIARADGKQYVPILRTVPEPPLSEIVARVASDGFPTIEEAIVFAEALAQSFNAFATMQAAKGRA